MHFSSTTALLALSTFSMTYAAPFANPQEDIVRRKVPYQVVNVDGESTSSAAPEIETVTVKSVTTAPGVAAIPITVTVTATPTGTSTPIPSSTPHSHMAPPPGASFFPPPNASSGSFRRGLMVAGDPLQFARGYESSTASVIATSLAARGWYSSPAPSPTSSAPSTLSLVARQFGAWGSSSSASPTSIATPAASLAVRQLDGSSASSSLPATPISSTLVSPNPLIVRGVHNQYYPGSLSSATPNSSFTLSPSANALLY